MSRYHESNWQSIWSILSFRTFYTANKLPVGKTFFMKESKVLCIIACDHPISCSRHKSPEPGTGREETTRDAKLTSSFPKKSYRKLVSWYFCLMHSLKSSQNKMQPVFIFNSNSKMHFFQFRVVILILLVLTKPSVILNYSEIGSGDYRERENVTHKSHKHEIGRIQEW